jgi:hypothetical protein
MVGNGLRRAAKASTQGGAERHGECPIEGQNTGCGGLRVQLELSEMMRYGLPQVAELLTERARVDALARLLGAVQRGDHGQLSQGLLIAIPAFS